MDQSASDTLEEVLYHQLPATGSHIRLLRSLNLADLRFELMSCPIDSAPVYEALSYPWGSLQCVDNIVINGHLRSIPSNLHSALKAVQGQLGVDDDEANSYFSKSPTSAEFTLYKDHPRSQKYLWVDALCINQEDLLERSRQVEIMATIYRSASRVWVWPGTECDADLRALRERDDWGSMVADDLSISSEPFEITHLLSPSMENLARAEYWSRMWIIQEFAVASEVVVVSYKEAVCISAKMLTALCEVETPTFGNMLAVMVKREGVQNFGKAPTRRLYSAPRQADLRLFPVLLTMFRAHNCSDPRDRVYSLLGLVDWISSGVEPLKPDYTITVDELARRLVHHLLKLNWVARSECELMCKFVGQSLDIDEISLFISIGMSPTVAKTDPSSFFKGVCSRAHDW